MINTINLTILTIAIIFFSGCTDKDKEEQKVQNADIIKINENFDWLLGNWERINEKEDRETFEIWEKKSNSEYHGMGFTMQNEDTIKQEKIQLVNIDGKWDLIVKVPEETESITFKITELKEDSFICENDSLDFPKMIKYWKDGNKINALVSGDDMEIPFEFERINEK
ncbi:MAG: hypothetical protein ABFS12_08915 [Bacteroidota bacterium]